MKNRYLLFLIIFIIFVSLSGCNEAGIELTNISDIEANPDNYIGKEVTLEGNCMNGEVKDDSGHSISYGYHENLIGEYRLTGIIRISETFSSIIIEVKKAEAL
jgi:hypothetical protein